MSFQDKRKITEQDVKDWGDDAPGKVGEMITYDHYLRNPPKVSALRREMSEEFARLRKLITDNR